MPPLEFQTLCWYGQDLDPKDADSDDGSSSDEGGEGEHQRFPKQLNRTYTIDIYGKTAQGQSVCMHVPFQPYFFVEIPDSMTDSTVRYRLFKSLQFKLKYKGLGNELVDHRIINRKKFYGFTNGRDFRFCALMFSSLAARNYAASILRKDYELYESNVDPILRLMHQRDLESTGWVRVNAFAPPDRYASRCDIEGCVPHQGSLERLDRTALAPLVIASFDIECISAQGGFPNPRDDGSHIISIATSFQRYGEAEPYKRSIVCLHETDPVDGVDLSWFDDERDVLCAWVASLCTEQADVLIGYNIWGFDMEYVFERARLFGGINDRRMREFFTATGKRTRHVAEAVNMTLSSSAYGNNEWVTFQTPGILQIDLMQIIKKEHKLDSYKLDLVAGHFLGEHKIDLPIPEMFRLFRGTSRDRGRIAEYCVRDTELPLKLMGKLAILPNMVEMAKATHVPIEYLIPRGQQIKVFSQILKKTRERGYLCPSRPFMSKEEKYEGATVLDAVTGAHWGVITCLDFASLYPSIMRAHNMCHSTVVLDARYDKLDGVEYFETDGVRFATNAPGILPELLKDLADFRKKAKKDMAAAKARGDEFAESLFNGKQLAYKVSMNSMYGFCGAANGFLPCIPIASSVTTVGRSMIVKTRDMIQENFKGSRIVYGDTDSVMVDFGVDDLPACFELGERAAAMVTASFPRPIELTFEKCYRPYLLFSKKRYAGLYFTRPDKPDKLDCKGITLVRRDSCKYVKQVLERVLHLIMYDRNIEAAVSHVKQKTRDLFAGRVPLADLVLSKTLKASAAVLRYQCERKCPKCTKGRLIVSDSGDKLVCGGPEQGEEQAAAARARARTHNALQTMFSAAAADQAKDGNGLRDRPLPPARGGCGFTDSIIYKNSTQPHITVALKLESRSPGSGPSSGDRVPFIYVEDNTTTKKGAVLASECTEDPAFYLASQDLPPGGGRLYVDYRYYLHNQLMKPVTDLLDIVVEDCQAALFADAGEEEYEAQRQTRIRATINLNNSQAEITSFFKPRAH